jgi:glutamate-1-semialdehyde aminotransferase
MTGFRLARGGVQELLNVDADIICFGKVIGGGLPVGAFAARAEIMDYLAPIGPLPSRNLIRKSIGHGCRIDDVTNVK